MILSDDPGLGKTLQALAAIIQSDSKKILVGCRRTATRTVWERETLRWAPGIATFVAQGSRREREWVMTEFMTHTIAFPKHPAMLVVNIEMIRAKRVVVCPQGLRDKCPAYAVDECKHKYEAEYTWPQLFDHEWDAIILDESHNLLASTKNYQSKGITQARYGAVQLRRKLRTGGLAVALSGTPFRSKLPKAWGTLNWLRPDVFTSYWRWAETYFGVEQGDYGKIIANGAKAPEPLDKEMWDQMLRPYYLRREKKEAAKDLPPILFAGTPINGEGTPNYVQLELEPAQAKAYREIVDDAETELQGGTLRTIGVLAEITRMRQFANAAHQLSGGKLLPMTPSNKIDWILEFMQEREGSGRKVVIASSFTELVEFVEQVLRKEGFTAISLTGKTSDRDRSDIVARFQDPNDPLQVVVINRKAGGESITLDAADDMIVIDPPWISDDDEQLTARIHRVSRMHQVTVYRLISTGTIEEWMANLTDEQRAALTDASPKKLSDKMRENVTA